MAENKFVPGMSAKSPRDGAPEFIKANVSVKIREFREFLDSLPQDQEWLNVDIKESRGGKLYAAINEWSPNGGGSSRHGGQPQRERQQQPTRSPAYDEFDSDSIPFISDRGNW